MVIITLNGFIDGVRIGLLNTDIKIKSSDIFALGQHGEVLRNTKVFVIKEQSHDFSQVIRNRDKKVFNGTIYLRERH